eukprot:scaffold4087_cov172-Chaetoceros_neogracile.AAC.5
MKKQEKAMLENTNDADELATAKQFLQNIDRRATPEVAARPNPPKPGSQFDKKHQATSIN